MAGGARSRAPPVSPAHDDEPFAHDLSPVDGPSLPAPRGPAADVSTASTPATSGVADRRRQPSYVAKTLVAGGIAGCVAKTAIAPLDRVKILFQASNPDYRQYSGRFIGAFQAVFAIHRREGVAGLFRGNSATLARIFPYAALQYMSYEQIKSLLNTPDDERPVTRLVAGSLAVADTMASADQESVTSDAGSPGLSPPLARRLESGFGSGALLHWPGMISVLGTYPLDLLRSRMAFDVAVRKRSLWTALLDTAGGRDVVGTTASSSALTLEAKRPTGLSALYRGFIPTIAGIIPYAGISFFTYDTLKSFAIRWQNRSRDGDSDVGTHAGKLSIPLRLLLGATAGATAQTAAYPLDVVRRRMQVHGLAGAMNQSAYTSMLTAFRQIIAAEGWRGLYVGLSINYIKVAPAMGLSFVTYETLKQWMHI